MRHEAHECKTALQRSQPGSRAGGRSPGGNPTQAQRVAARCKCHGEVTKKKPDLGWRR